jgi:hypothetical protein
MRRFFLKNKKRNTQERSDLFREKTVVHKDSEHRIATAQSPSTPPPGVDAEGAYPLKTPQKGLRTIDKKTVKHTLRMTEKESQKLQKWADRAGLTKAEYVRQKVFGKEPQPMPTPAFWNHLADLSAIHDQIHNITLRKQMQKLILEIQAEATLPKEVRTDGNNEAVAHQGPAEGSN